MSSDKGKIINIFNCGLCGTARQFFLLRQKKLPRHNKIKLQVRGFSLLEVIFVIAILAMATVALYSLFNLSLKMVWENKARVGATQLANQKLEIARNLAYDEVGTVGGTVFGTIPQYETIVLNGINYQVYTNVVYIDDAFDGTFETNPVDLLNTDYKRILVEVSWPSQFSSSPVKFYSDIAPKGVESALGGGTLVITVFDYNGLPVSNASVRIYNGAASPIIDTTTFSNDQGQLILPGVPIATESYEITVSKAGYSGDQTYDTTVDLPTPDKPHLTVFEGAATSASFNIDELADMIIYIKDINDLPLGNITLRMQGDKRIGLNGAGQPVYKVDEEIVSNGNGVINLPDIEWDTYEITIEPASGYDILEMDPANPVSLMPLDDLGVNIKLRPTAEHSLIVVVKDANDLPVEGANVRVTNTLGFDEALLTGTAGQAFFTPLSYATTTVLATKSGYQDYENEILLYGYTMEPVIMTE